MTYRRGVGGRDWGWGGGSGGEGRPLCSGGCLQPGSGEHAPPWSCGGPPRLHRAALAFWWAGGKPRQCACGRAGDRCILRLLMLRCGPGRAGSPRVSPCERVCVCLATFHSIYSIFETLGFHSSSQLNCGGEILEMFLIRGVWGGREACSLSGVSDSHSAGPQRSARPFSLPSFMGKFLNTKVVFEAAVRQ